jgi:predicted alpha/beta-hydrolase family hydrolase
VACRTAGAVGAAGVLLLAFPLVPPDARKDADKHARALAARRPELTAPSRLGLPMVVAQGARDPFGTAAELRDVLRRTRRVEVVEVPAADHGLRTAKGGPDPAPVLLRAALRAVALARGE